MKTTLIKWLKRAVLVLTIPAFVLANLGTAHAELPRTQPSNIGLCAYFNDVPENYRYCEAIEWAKGEGIFKGYEDGSFRPEKSISRAEVLKMIFEALDIKTLEKGNLWFSDVDDSDWFVKYLNSAVSLGVVNGYSDGTFKGNREVSRVEALVMFLNTVTAKDGIILQTDLVGDPYLDTPYSESTAWYYEYVRFAKKYELTDNEYMFRPQTAMTRAEMADMLYRFSQL